VNICGDPAASPATRDRIQESPMARSNKSARHRAKLKAKHKKQRLRKAGLLAKRKPGARMKRVSRKVTYISY